MEEGNEKTMKGDKKIKTLEQEYEMKTMEKRQQNNDKGRQ